MCLGLFFWRTNGSLSSPQMLQKSKSSLVIVTGKVHMFSCSFCLQYRSLGRFPENNKLFDLSLLPVAISLCSMVRDSAQNISALLTSGANWQSWSSEELRTQVLCSTSELGPRHLSIFESLGIHGEPLNSTGFLVVLPWIHPQCRKLLVLERMIASSDLPFSRPFNRQDISARQLTY